MTDDTTSEQVRATTATPDLDLVLADDHRVVRSGLRMLLEAVPNFRVVAEAGSVADTIATVERLRPNVLLLDLNMGGESSLDAIPQLREISPDTAIIVLTMQDNPAFARAALRAGATGYLLKEAAGDELVTAVSMAAEGRTYVNPEFGARLASTVEAPAQPDGLSPRELEVLRLIALGHTNPEIARLLTVSVRTVESHRAHIHQKVSLSSRAEMVAYARRNGLLD